MSTTKVKNYLKNFNIENNILEFNVSSATVKESATAISCEESEIAKTLSFMVNSKPILIVIAGDYKVDNTKFKQIFKTKSKNNTF